MLELNQLQILLLTASNQLKEIRQSAGLPITSTHEEVLDLLRVFRDMPRGEVGDESVLASTVLVQEAVRLVATYTDEEVLESLRVFRDVPRGELGDKSVEPTTLQFVLVEHLANSAMSQLNEIRQLLGLPTHTSHAALMNTLRDMLRGEREVQPAPEMGDPRH